MNTGRPPALVLVLELESSGAQVGFDVACSDDLGRLFDWLHADPLRLALFALSWTLRADTTEPESAELSRVREAVGAIGAEQPNAAAAHSTEIPTGSRYRGMKLGTLRDRGLAGKAWTRWALARQWDNPSFERALVVVAGELLRGEL